MIIRIMTPNNTTEYLSKEITVSQNIIPVGLRIARIVGKGLHPVTFI